MKTRVATPLYRSNTMYATLLVVTFFGLIALYMYFLSMSVVHVVLRKEASHVASTLESEIAFLEAEYIESQHLVSNEMARLAQFSETSEKIFVTAQAPTLVYSDINR